MPLADALADIATRLRQGRFPNEQAISQGVVLRVFQELGWNTWDTSLVWPEYQTGEGRADFALCHPPGRPAVLTEVKQPGKAEDAVRQALEYAFHSGVPFVVLTDGRTWSFYLPAEQGSYEDRRVYKLDIYERQPAEAAAALERYLSYSRIESGEALEAARKEYRSRNRRSQARAAIPQTWRELTEKGDEVLVDLLVSAVELKAGVRPEADDVATFLSALVPPPTAETSQRRLPGATAGAPRRPVATDPAVPTTTSAAGYGTSRSGELRLRDVTYAYRTAIEATVLVMRKLAEEDPTFLERCAAHPDFEGRRRRYIARDPADLYPGREDLRDMREPLPGGWWMATNINNVLKKAILHGAAQVAGLEYGKDLVVEF